MLDSDSSPSPSPSDDESLDSDELPPELLLLLLTDSAGEVGRWGLEEAWPRCPGKVGHSCDCSLARSKSSAETAISTAI